MARDSFPKDLACDQNLYHTVSFLHHFCYVRAQWGALCMSKIGLAGSLLQTRLEMGPDFGVFGRHDGSGMIPAWSQSLFGGSIGKDQDRLQLRRQTC